MRSSDLLKIIQLHIKAIRLVSWERHSLVSSMINIVAISLVFMFYSRPHLERASALRDNGKLRRRHRRRSHNISSLLTHISTFFLSIYRSRRSVDSVYGWIRCWQDRKYQEGDSVFGVRGCIETKRLNFGEFLITRHCLLALLSPTRRPWFMPSIK